MERGSRKRSSSARSEKTERVGDRQEKMERYCATGQSTQRAVVSMEGEGEEFNIYSEKQSITASRSQWDVCFSLRKNCIPLGQTSRCDEKHTE